MFPTFGVIIVGPLIDGLVPWGHAIWDNGALPSAASAQSLGIDVGIFLADAGLRERAHHTSGETPGGGAGKGRCQPSGGDHGTNAGNGHDAETGEEARESAHGCANAGPGSCGIGAIVTAIEGAIMVV